MYGVCCLREGVTFRACQVVKVTEEGRACVMFGVLCHVQGMSGCEGDGGGMCMCPVTNSTLNWTHTLSVDYFIYFFFFSLWPVRRYPLLGRS